MIFPLDMAHIRGRRGILSSYGPYKKGKRLSLCIWAISGDDEASSPDIGRGRRENDFPPGYGSYLERMERRRQI